MTSAIMNRAIAISSGMKVTFLCFFFLAAFLFILFFLSHSGYGDKTTAKLTCSLLLPCSFTVYGTGRSTVTLCSQRRRDILFSVSAFLLKVVYYARRSNNDWDGLNISADTNELADPRNAEAQTTCSVSIFSRFQGILDRVRFTRRILEIPSGFPLPANTLKYRIMNNLKAIWFRG